MCVCVCVLCVYTHTRTYTQRLILRNCLEQNLQDRLTGGDTGKSCSLSLKAVCLQDSLLEGGQSLFCSGLQLIRHGPLTLWKVTCFTESPPIEIFLFIYF